jgi:hypothetical protein
MDSDHLQKSEAATDASDQGSRKDQIITESIKLLKHKRKEDTIGYFQGMLQETTDNL